MSEFWVVVMLPIVIGTTFMAFNQTLRRFVLKGGVTLKEGQISPMQYLTLTNAGICLLFGMIYVGRWGLTMPAVLPGFWRVVVLGATVNIIVQFMYAKAASLDAGEVSLTAPLQAMTPGLVTGLALLLGEYPGRTGIAGVFLMICGSYVLMYAKTPERWYEYFTPFQRLMLLRRWRHLTQEERNKNVVVAISLGSAVIGTFALLFDGLYTRRGVDIQGLVLASMVLVAILAVVYAGWYALWPDVKPGKHIERIRDVIRDRRFLLVFAVASVLWVGHILSIQPTYNRAFVAYVGTLKRFSVLLAVILGFFFFKEKEFKKRLWAAVLIVLGAVLISMDGLPARLSSRIEGLGL